MFSIVGESGGVKVGSRGRFTAGQDADQDQHASLRLLWFTIFICSALLESRVGCRLGAVV